MIRIPKRAKRSDRRRLVVATLTVAAAMVLSAPVALIAADAHGWRVDPAHAEVNFTVKHFFTPVTGSFGKFEVDLNYDEEKPERSTVKARIWVESVSTGNQKRDEHLRSADWFEADAYPEMTFVSSSVRRKGSDLLIAKGLLTIKGRSQEIELPIRLLGVQPIPEEMRPMLGGTREVASFEASTSIQRKAFDVGTGSWAATMVVGGEVSISILLEAHLS